MQLRLSVAVPRIDELSKMKWHIYLMFLVAKKAPVSRSSCANLPTYPPLPSKGSSITSTRPQGVPNTSMAENHWLSVLYDNMANNYALQCQSTTSPRSRSRSGIYDKAKALSHFLTVTIFSVHHHLTNTNVFLPQTYMLMCSLYNWYRYTTASWFLNAGKQTIFNPPD